MHGCGLRRNIYDDDDEADGMWQAGDAANTDGIYDAPSDADGAALCLLGDGALG